MQDFFSSFGQFQLDSFEAEGSGSGFSFDVTNAGSDANPDEYEISANDVETTGTKGQEINENTVDNQAEYDSSGQQINVKTYWEKNTPAVKGTTGGVSLDIQDAEERTTDNGTTYFVINLSNIRGASFSRAVSESDPLEFSNGLTLAGLAGLAVKVLNGALTGGSFSGTRGRVTIGGSVKNNALAYGDGYNAGITTIATNGFQATLEDEDGNPVSAIFDISDSDTANVRSITTGDLPADGNATVTVNGDYNFLLNGNAFKLAHVDGAADVVFKYADGDIALDLSDVETTAGEVLKLSAAGGADTLIPPDGAGFIEIGNTEFSYNTNGKAYFTLKNDAVTGFVFGNNNDSIHLPSGTTIALYEGDTDTAVDLGFEGTIGRTIIKRDDGYTVNAVFENVSDFITIDGTNENYTLGTVTYDGNDVDIPTITGDTTYTVTMTSAGVFTLSDLDEGTVVEGDNFTITVQDTDATVLFNTAGNIIGLPKGYEGELPLAAGLATNGFTINGVTIFTNEAITITADGTTVTDITGLGDGSVINVVNGADVNIDFATNANGEGRFTVGNAGVYKIYHVLQDADGVVITPGGIVTGLDADAHLHLDNYDSSQGTITVNGVPYSVEALTAAAANVGNSDIIGFNAKDTTRGTISFMEDPDHPLFNPFTTATEIRRDWLGLNYDSVIMETDGTSLDRSADTVRSEVILNDSDPDSVANVKFNNLGKNLALVRDDARGTKNIALGDRGDAVIMMGRDEYSTVNIVGGAGHDTIFVGGRMDEDVVVHQGSMKTNIDLSKGGVDKIHTYAAANANIEINNYDETSLSGVVFHDPELPYIKNLTDAIQDELLVFEDGGVTAIDRGEHIAGTDQDLTATGTDRKTRIKVNNKNDKHQTMIRLFGYKDNSDAYSDDYGQLVGFTGDNGGVLDASDIKEDLVLIGNRKSVDGKAGSSLKSGDYDDTLFGGAGDTLDAGKGNNQIILTDPAVNEDRGAATIIIGEGHDTITNLNSGFDGDIINVDLAAASTDVSFDGTNLVVKNTADKFSATAAVTTADGEGDFVKQLFVNNNESIKAAIAVEGGTITVGSGDVPNYYKAPNGGVDFSAYDGEVTVDMDGDWVTSAVGGETATFDGMNSLIGGSGNTLFKGGSSDETLVAGTGEASLYGAGGKNVLMGQADNEDKIGSTEFFVQGINNGAQNTISGFEFIEDGGSNTATFDNLALGLNENGVIDLKANSDGSISIAVQGNGGEGGATEKVTIEGAAGKEFLVDRGTETETVAQIAATENTINNSYVDFYSATEKNATITIGDVTSAKVWLEAPDYSDGVEYVGDYTVIDARNSNAAVEMAGNDAANTIYGGLGNASMWGGAGNANDVMYGGSAHNEFYYEVGNGNDTIMSANNGDIIHLGTTLDQIDFDKTTMSSSGIEITFTDGGKLNINSGADVSFSFDDGTNVKANRQTNQFE